MDLEKNSKIASTFCSLFQCVWHLDDNWRLGMMDELGHLRRVPTWDHQLLCPRGKHCSPGAEDKLHA